MGINTWELLVLGVLALVILGPDKLPRYAAEAARTLRQVRQMAREARTEVRRELGPEFQDISLRDLDPRGFVTSSLLGDDEDAPASGRSGASVPRPGGASTPGARSRSGGSGSSAHDAGGGQDAVPGPGAYGDIT